MIDVKRSTRMRRRVVHFNHHVVLFRHTAWISSGWRPRPFRRDRRGWCAGTWGNKTSYATRAAADDADDDADDRTGRVERI